MTLKDYIDFQYIWGLLLLVSFPLLIGTVFYIKKRATKPLKFSFFTVIPIVLLWVSYFFYDDFLSLKIESDIREFVSKPYNDYDVYKDGNIDNSGSIIYALRRLSTRFTNKTFSSRTNERTFNIKRGNYSLTLRVYDSSSRESFYWVVYTVPGTNFKYIGRINLNEVR